MAFRNWAVATVRYAYAVRDLTSPDRPWDAAKTFTWAIIEVNTGLICAYVPVLNPIFRAIAQPRRSLDRPLIYTRRKLSPLKKESKCEKGNSRDYMELQEGRVEGGVGIATTEEALRGCTPDEVITEDF